MTSELEISDSSGIPIFNRDELLARLCQDEELLEEVLDVYFDDTPKQINILEEAIKTGDSEKIHRQAHTIKGASGNVSATAMREIAYRLELAGKNGDLETAMDLFKKLNLEMNSLKAHLKRL